MIQSIGLHNVYYTLVFSIKYYVLVFRLKSFSWSNILWGLYTSTSVQFTRLFEKASLRNTVL